MHMGLIAISPRPSGCAWRQLARALRAFLRQAGRTNAHQQTMTTFIGSDYDLHMGCPSDVRRGVMLPLFEPSHSKYWQPVAGSRQTRTSSPLVRALRTLPSRVVVLIGAASHPARTSAPTKQNASAVRVNSKPRSDLESLPSVGYARVQSSALGFAGSNPAQPPPHSSDRTSTISPISRNRKNGAQAARMGG